MKKILLLIVTIIALSLTACGNSGPSTKINLTMTDFLFSPGEFTVPAGEQITLNVTHDGTVVHDFIIMKYGVDAGHMFDEDDEPNVYWKLKVQPGITESVTFTAPEQPGIYQVVCGMAGHLQSGMVGKLIVTDQQ